MWYGDPNAAVVRQAPDLLLVDGPELEAIYGMLQQFRARSIEGIFGPPVPGAGDAPLFDPILGLTGRDPRWELPS